VSIDSLRGKRILIAMVVVGLTIAGFSLLKRQQALPPREVDSREAKSITPSQVADPAGSPEQTIAEAKQGSRPSALDVTAVQRSQDGFVELPDAVSASNTLNRDEHTAAEDIEIVQSLLADYRRVYGENPTGGLNEEITDRLRGRNPKRIIFLPPDHSSISPKGELLDRWGTPYFFHPVSRELIELRSAGPDRKLWTDDDVTD
jgi:hypothetical protein